MPDVLTWSGIFVVSIAVLLYASQRFIVAAELIGLSFRIPTFIIGVTIVAMGTSLPELVSSIIAVAEGSPAIVVGNVVGSNIANICLILAIVAILSKAIRIDYEIANVDLPLLIGSTFLMGIFLMDGQYSLLEAFLSLAGLAVYLVYALTTQKASPDTALEVEVPESQTPQRRYMPWLILVVSGVFIYFSADYTVHSIIQLSALLHIGEEVIALTAVSLGTSLPELVVSVMAARKGNPDMAVGNILGSNIFNSFAVMGVPRLFGHLVVPEGVLTFSLPLMVGISLLYFFVAQNKLISRWEGFMLLIFYVYFIGQTVIDVLPR